ncbi:hypothetical protein [Pontibacter sp. G13]|uniref:hypothetical protein n=1 Tax=Pontibacter sp. G13 TaxID=3074898 RepID=UPI002889E11C|nr:hypothetical protein [Pontibacter sp. G13]WNJ20898.1 hypothetical protein RJD25_10500 [Pontibacter sp. G13]
MLFVDQVKEPVWVLLVHGEHHHVVDDEQLGLGYPPLLGLGSISDILKLERGDDLFETVPWIWEACTCGLPERIEIRGLAPTKKCYFLIA